MDHLCVGTLSSLGKFHSPALCQGPGAEASALPSSQEPRVALFRLSPHSPGYPLSAPPPRPLPQDTQEPFLPPPCLQLSQTD